MNLPVFLRVLLQIVKERQLKAFSRQPSAFSQINAWLIADGGHLVLAQVVAQFLEESRSLSAFSC
jgi:hypothetical protein